MAKSKTFRDTNPESRAAPLAGSDHMAAMLAGTAGRTGEPVRASASAVDSRNIGGGAGRWRALPLAPCPFPFNQAGV